MTVVHVKSCFQCTSRLRKLRGLSECEAEGASGTAQQLAPQPTPLVRLLAEVPSRPIIQAGCRRNEGGPWLYLKFRHVAAS